MPLSSPALGALRIASPQDIKRIGTVATCGFSGGAVCAWNRPFLAQYPTDTLNSFCQIFSDFIRSPRHVVLVAVDAYDPLENTTCMLDIPIRDEGVVVAGGEEVVVGVAVWALEEGSERSGDFQNDTSILPGV